MLPLRPLKHLSFAAALLFASGTAVHAQQLETLPLMEGIVPVSYLSPDSCGPIESCYDQSCGDDSCCDLGCTDSCLGGGLLQGLIKPSDQCFNDFISPMSNFVFFEDPRSVTELRPIFVNHWVPDTIGNGVPAGGSIQLLALQFRARLTDRLSLIAVKDGFIWDNTDGALDGLLNDGWAAVSAGLKYNFLRDTCNGTLASAGFTYELPIGSQRTQQDVGDGEFHLFVTGGQRLLEGDAHLLSSFGWRLPVDGDVQNSMIHWSNHLDYRVTNNLYLFTELVWWHWTDDPDNGAPLGVAGQDLFNLPFSDVEGRDLVTQSVGVKLKPQDNIEIGLAYEFPLSDFQDVIDDRLTIDMIYRF